MLRRQFNRLLGAGAVDSALPAIDLARAGVPTR